MSKLYTIQLTDSNSGGSFTGVMTADTSTKIVSVNWIVYNLDIYE